MAELIHDYDCLWVVEHSYDAIRKKKIPAVRKEQERCKQWKMKEPLVFNSEADAQQFVLDRKAQQIVAAQEEVKDLERKFKTLKKKFKRD